MLIEGVQEAREPKVSDARIVITIDQDELEAGPIYIAPQLADTLWTEIPARMPSVHADLKSVSQASERFACFGTDDARATSWSIVITMRASLTLAHEPLAPPSISMSVTARPRGYLSVDGALSCSMRTRIHSKESDIYALGMVILRGLMHCVPRRLTG